MKNLITLSIVTMVALGAGCAEPKSAVTKRLEDQKAAEQAERDRLQAEQARLANMIVDMPSDKVWAFEGYTAEHPMLDLSVSPGGKILAPVDGKVTISEEGAPTDLEIAVAEKNLVISLKGLHPLKLETVTEAKRGDHLGTFEVTDETKTEMPVLRLEVKVDGKSVCPEPYLTEEAMKQLKAVMLTESDKLCVEAE